MDKRYVENTTIEAEYKRSKPRVRRRAMTVESWARFCYSLNQATAKVFKDFGASKREQELALRMLLSHYVTDAENTQDK